MKCIRTVSNKQNGHFRSVCACDRQDGLPALSTCIVVTKISWVFCVSPTSAAVGFVVSSRAIGTSVRRRKGIASGNDILETWLATTSGLSLDETSLSEPLNPPLTPGSHLSSCSCSCSFEKKLEFGTRSKKLRPSHTLNEPMVFLPITHPFQAYIDRTISVLVSSPFNLLSLVYFRLRLLQSLRIVHCPCRRESFLIGGTISRQKRPRDQSDHMSRIVSRLSFSKVT
jgi:hypothetical protein